jgi:hypothetical protein
MPEPALINLFLEIFKEAPELINDAILKTDELYKPDIPVFCELFPQQGFIVRGGKKYRYSYCWDWAGPCPDDTFRKIPIISKYGHDELAIITKTMGILIMTEEQAEETINQAKSIIAEGGGSPVSPW